MIHTLRENETFADIAYIYRTDEQAVCSANSYKTSLPPLADTAVWVPCGKKVYFYDGGVNTNEDEIEAIKQTFLTANNMSEADLKKNAMLSSDYSESIFTLGLIQKVDERENNFVNADNVSRHADRLYIDGYDLNGSELNLPYDYPAINACALNKKQPMFVLDDITRYSDDKILMQLKHDLLFKDYTGCALLVASQAETASAKKLLAEIKTEGFATGIIGKAKVLSAFDMDNADEFFLTAERNLFDFASFAEAVNKLSARFPTEKLGVFYSAAAADIDKKTKAVVNPTPEMLAKLFKSRSISKVIFDGNSQLCFASYEEEGNAHNLVFEDIRSFYSKINYLKSKGIKKIITDEAEKVHIYSEILKLLS